MSILDVIEEGRKRWEEIEKQAEIVQGDLDRAAVGNQNVTRLLLLLVEHMRPMNPSQDELDDAMKGISEVLASIGKK